MRDKIIKIGQQQYRFNYYVFISIPAILLIIAIIILARYDFDKQEHIYIKCPDNSISQCENSLFNTSFCYNRLGYNNPICTQEFLPIGYEYGIKPPTIVKQFPNIAIAFLFLAFLINHIIFNRKFRFLEFKETINEAQKETEKEEKAETINDSTKEEENQSDKKIINLKIK